MILRFYAREDKLVFSPGYTRKASGGGRPLYVGRKYDDATRGFPATAEPFECDSKSIAGQRLAIQLAKDPTCLYAADKETAQAVNIPFVPVEIKDGLAVPKKGAA